MVRWSKTVGMEPAQVNMDNVDTLPMDVNLPEAEVQEAGEGSESEEPTGADALENGDESDDDPDATFVQGHTCEDFDEAAPEVKAEEEIEQPDVHPPLVDPNDTDGSVALKACIVAFELKFDLLFVRKKD